MDTRRLSGTTEIETDDLAHSVEADVEIVELSASARQRNRLLGPAFLLVAIVVLAGLIAFVGVPSRTPFSLNNPLPNLMQQGYTP